MLKFSAFKKSLKHEAKEFYIHLGKRILGESAASKEFLDNKLTKEKIKEIEKEAKDTARNAILKYKDKKLSGPLLGKILYFLT